MSDVKFREAIFPVEAGGVTVRFPENMSKDCWEDLAEYLKVFLEKQPSKEPAQEGGE